MSQREDKISTPDASERGVKFNLTPGEHTNFSLSHKHTGIHGDGQRIAAASLSWTGTITISSAGVVFTGGPITITTAGSGLILTTPNGLHSYRVGVANNGALTSTKIT